MHQSNATRKPHRPAGVIRSHGGLTYLNVFASGHMVPLDQPAAALEMLTAFTGTDLRAVQLWEVRACAAFARGGERWSVCVHRCC